MSDIEFISYKATPNDKYTLGVATVKYTGEIILSYKKSKTKEGNVFYASPSISVDNGDGSKEFVHGFSIDSKSKEKIIQDLIRDHVKQFEACAQPLSSIPYPSYGTAATHSSMREVAEDGQLPF